MHDLANLWPKNLTIWHSKTSKVTYHFYNVIRLRHRNTSSNFFYFQVLP